MVESALIAVWSCNSLWQNAAPWVQGRGDGLQGHKRWHELITSRITDTVKLVGPTISCEGSPQDGNVNGQWRTNPHVQSYVLATDQARSLAQADTPPTVEYELRGAAPMRRCCPALC